MHWSVLRQQKPVSHHNILWQGKGFPVRSTHPVIRTGSPETGCLLSQPVFLRSPFLISRICPFSFSDSVSLSSELIQLPVLCWIRIVSLCESFSGRKSHKTGEESAAERFFSFPVEFLFPLGYIAGDLQMTIHFSYSSSHFISQCF